MGIYLRTLVVISFLSIARRGTPSPPKIASATTNSMPHSLTPHQHEYFEYIRSYIKENEASPRLDEIADHFSVKPPTAHKTLEALDNVNITFGVWHI